MAGGLDFGRPIDRIIAIVVLGYIYVALIPTLTTVFTSLAAIAGLGVFATVIGTIAPILIGAGLLLWAVRAVKHTFAAN